MASVLDLIGDTPLIEVTRIDRGPCRLFLKLESANPSGSLKDRPARTMIEAAEADGRLKAGGTIVEATAGNTGLGLTLVGGRKGYRTLLVVPDKMAREKVLHAKATGAEVVITRSDVGKGHPDYYQDLAEAITRRTAGAFFVNQFANPANPRAHETTTGPEILRQMDGDVDAIVVGVGSGGTLTGIGRFMLRASPKTTMVLADPEGSVLAPYVESGRMVQAGSWAVEGIGEDFVPPNADLSLVSRAYAHAAGGGAALLPRASGAQARREPRLRLRREISVQSVQSHLPGAGRLEPSRSARHRARRRRQPLQRGHRGGGTARRQSAHGVRAHALERRLAVARRQCQRARDRPRRRERCAGRAARGARGSRPGLRAAGRGGDGAAARDDFRRRADRRSPALVPQGLRRHRHGRRSISRPGDPSRPDQLFPDCAVTALLFPSSWPDVLRCPRLAIAASKPACT